MNKTTQQFITDFIEFQPKTLKEISDYTGYEYVTIANYMRQLCSLGLVKKIEKRQIGNAGFNQYLATTMDERIALEESNKRVTTALSGFANDPLMKAFYSKENI